MSRDDALQRLAMARLYVVSGEADPAAAGEALLRALDGGADVVQLRHKTAEKGVLLEVARRLAAEARRRGAVFIVNDHVDLAIAAGADGVHLGQDDLPLGAARELWRRGVVGCSTHSLDQVRGAVAAGADYLGVGPVHATPTKPGRPAVGLELVTEVARLDIALPWFAIGGIDPDNIGSVLEAGASRVAVVRAVTAAPDPAAAARALKARLGAAAAVGSAT